MTEREVRVIVHAPAHLSLAEIAEMFWDKLDKPGTVFEICAIAVSSAPSCTDLSPPEQEVLTLGTAEPWPGNRREPDQSHS